MKGQFSNPMNVHCWSSFWLNRFKFLAEGILDLKSHLYVVVYHLNFFSDILFLKWTAEICAESDTDSYAVRLKMTSLFLFTTPVLYPVIQYLIFCCSIAANMLVNPFQSYYFLGSNIHFIKMAPMPLFLIFNYFSTYFQPQIFWGYIKTTLFK